MGGLLEKAPSGPVQSCVVPTGSLPNQEEWQRKNINKIGSFQLLYKTGKSVPPRRPLLFDVPDTTYRDFNVVMVHKEN